MKALVVSLVLLLLPTFAIAQTTYTVPSLPANVAVTWDDPSPVAGRPLNYVVTLDGNPSIAVPSAKPTPCQACATVTLDVTLAGTHTITVRGVNSAGASVAGTLTFTAMITIAVPSTPTNLQLTVPSSSSSVTTIPPATSLTDATGVVWTQGAVVPCLSPALTVCKQNLRSGTVVGGGAELDLIRGGIYGLGVDGQWYQWLGTAWSAALGLTKPQ